MVLELTTHGFRTYISEPDRGEQSWIDQEDARDAVYGNRRRIRGDRGKRLLRRRGEHVERSFAHAYDTGGIDRPSRSELIRPLGLTTAEKQDLVAFLNTLTGEAMPFELPALPR